MFPPNSFKVSETVDPDISRYQPVEFIRSFASFDCTTQFHSYLFDFSWLPYSQSFIFAIYNFNENVRTRLNLSRFGIFGNSFCGSSRPKFKFIELNLCIISWLTNWTGVKHFPNSKFKFIILNSIFSYTNITNLDLSLYNFKQCKQSKN